ncbi:hypothetical protein NITMOv2_1170 [Nitrospira moscoviensis]|uniref:Uncharacterized protein n=1 Tax=Nitrospira moscoviensis TaxID=42253 RepID=A0A0K2G9F2_NITMO|nr:hypothetical protein NITMOv2_1170 [Nitrospira moscoviensis]
MGLSTDLEARDSPRMLPPCRVAIVLGKGGGHAYREPVHHIPVPHCPALVFLRCSLSLGRSGETH